MIRCEKKLKVRDHETFFLKVRVSSIIRDVIRNKMEEAMQFLNNYPYIVQ